MKQVGSKMGRCEWKAQARRNHVFLSLLLGVRSTALMGSTSTEAVSQPRQGMFPETSSVLIGRMIQKASVLDEGMSRSCTHTTGINPVNEQSGLPLHAR